MSRKTRKYRITIPEYTLNYGEEGAPYRSAIFGLTNLSLDEDLIVSKVIATSSYVGILSMSVVEPNSTLFEEGDIIDNKKITGTGRGDNVYLKDIEARIGNIRTESEFIEDNANATILTYRRILKDEYIVPAGKALVMHYTPMPLTESPEVIMDLKLNVRR